MLLPEDNINFHTTKASTYYVLLIHNNIVLTSIRVIINELVIIELIAIELISIESIGEFVNYILNFAHYVFVEWLNNFKINNRY